MPGPEYTDVEQPFIDQLQRMGWKHVTGNLDHPSVTGRDAFSEVILKPDLTKALQRINPWANEEQIHQGYNALVKPGGFKLMEINQSITKLLHGGISITNSSERNRTLHFIDWNNPLNNKFLAVNQLRVDCPSGQQKKYILPDITLFINGIPVVVVECKAQGVSSPLVDAIDQLQRYSNQRKRYEGKNEGNEKLFWYNQFMVASCFDVAKAGTICASSNFYKEWKDTSPFAMSEVAESLGVELLSSQQKLVAGMLRPEILIDLIRHFVLFKNDEGFTYKIVARYQQFRAVQLAVRRLQTGKTKEEDGEFDRRGGIIWHTQGSGKSLTMMFLVRKMRSMQELRKFKVVIVTDRTSLQNQLSEDAAYTEDNVMIGKDSKKVMECLSVKGPGIVFAMIQKYQADDKYPVLNDDTNILVMIDEAHRSHGNTLHSNLLLALPNCAKIGFTGTPIIMGKKKQTHEIFGEYIDKYRIKESEEDGSTVPILYEGKTTYGAVKDGGTVDDLFEYFFSDNWTEDDQEKIKMKYASKGQVMEAVELIKVKAKDMLQHYVINILPNGLKAQVVAYSRKATIRYYDSFIEAQKELVEELESLEPEFRSVGKRDITGLRKDVQFKIRAYPYLEKIKALKFAPVFSGDNNDDPTWKEWSHSSKIKNRIKEFKKEGDLAFLIVKSMLLTGFDAPIEQVMYLDRGIREAELLQAIARVNRTRTGKTCGVVVDYYGVTSNLKEALKAYSDDDVEGNFHSIKNEIPKLRDQCNRVINIFDDVEGGIDNTEACVANLRDEKLRAKFQVQFKEFLNTLDILIHWPEAYEYYKPSKKMRLIQETARRLYRDNGVTLGKDVGEKVRKLIDDHLISLGIDTKIPLVAITDADFDNELDKHVSDRAKASEMEHAMRYHIRKHFNEDPARYQKLSDRLRKILTDLEGVWEQQVMEFESLRKEVTEEPDDDSVFGEDTSIYGPFYGMMATYNETEKLKTVAIELVDHITQELQMVGFWEKSKAQENLTSYIFNELDRTDLFDFDQCDEIAEKLLNLAKANHDKLVNR
jgi:type I restriction enzyme, R subunit